MDTLRTQYDVVVVGAGMAGLCAAITAAERGADVLVLEKLPFAGGTLPFSSGFLFCNDPLRDDIVPGYEPRPSATVKADFEDAVAWLGALGIEMVEATGAHAGYRIQPDPVSGALDPLLNRLGAAGGQVRFDTTVKSLVVAPSGGVEGVIVKSPSRQIGAGAVILATGGFQGDPELVTRYIAPAERLFWRANRGTTGDGFRMGMSVGAATSAGLGAFVGHLSPCDGNRVVELAPETWRGATMAFIKDVVLLNLAGQRFVDESHKDAAAVNALARDSRGIGIAVFDSVVHDNYARQRQPKPGDTRTGFDQWRDLGARVAKSETLGELFALLADLGLAVGSAEDTMKSYDRAAMEGSDRSLPVPRRAKLHRCAVPPYYAMLVCPDVTYTEGGLRVGDDYQVLDHDGDGIAGLYAIGETAGLVSLASQAGGLGTALATGWRAGQVAATAASVVREVQTCGNYR